MTVIWWILGSAAYLLLGAAFTRIVAPDNDGPGDTVYRGLLVVLWPLFALLIAPVVLLLALSRLAGGKP